jgi:hypothetical protein
VGDPPPLPRQPRARLQRDRRRGYGRAEPPRIGGDLLQLACDGLGETAIGPLLKLMRDPSDQQVAVEAHRRRQSMQPPPFLAQLEDRQLREPRERLCAIDRRFVHLSDRAAPRCDSGERRPRPWTMSTGSRASFSPCPPGNPARCAVANLSPASFSSSACGGVLESTAAGVALARDFAFDLALPFLGAALLEFWDFSMEMVDMVLGSVGSWRRN